MFRKTLRLVVMLAIVATAIPAAAQTTVAMIDVQRVLTEADSGKEASSALKVLQDRKLEEAQAMQSELEALREQYEKQRLTLTDEKLSELTKSIKNRSISLKRFQDDAQREIEFARDKELERLEARIMPIVDTIGKEKGLTLIFDKYRAGLLYADEATDITDEVIQRFNTAN